MAEAAKPRQWQLKWIKADGFRMYLQDESEDFAMTGLGIEESAVTMASVCPTKKTLKVSELWLVLDQ